MTYKDALKVMCMGCIKYPCNSLKSNNHCHSYNILNFAIEKQTPMKLHVYSDGYADEYEVWEEHCPVCDYDFDGSNYEFCPHCGQRIDLE